MWRPSVGGGESGEEDNAEGPGRKGYDPKKKAEILAAAKKENLTGAQVKQPFGISTLTFYRWRGPVRGRKKRGHLVGSKNKAAGSTVRAYPSVVRQAVRVQMEKMLPGIIREEVERALKG